MKKLNILLVIVGVAMAMSSCTMVSNSMKTPAHHVEFAKEDFSYSNQLTGEAVETKVLMVDWARLFKKEYGEVEGSFNRVSVPVIGGLVAGKVNFYALYNVMRDNPGYDVVFFPQFETKKLSILPFFQQTRVKVTTRLGKIKE